MSGPQFDVDARLPDGAWERLAQVVAEAGFVLDVDVPGKRFAGGLANENWMISVDGKPVVLRKAPDGPQIPGANSREREHRILSRLWKAYPLAPRSLLVCEDDAVIGVPFLLSEFRSGATLHRADPIITSADAETATKLAHALATAHAQLHAVDAAAVDLESLGNPAGFNARTVKRWAETVPKYPLPTAVDVERRDRVAGWLGANTPSDGDATLIHNDLKLDNMLVDPSSLAPVAVLDWDQGTRGSPLFDFAMGITFWAEPHDPEGFRSEEIIRRGTPGMPTRREVAAMYGELSGRDLSDLGFHLVLAEFKLAGIFLQLAERFRVGATNNPRYATLDKVAAACIEKAEQFIEESW
ncbi:MAG: phosphotransferase family protein [Acidimicrobiia bacterium]